MDEFREVLNESGLSQSAFARRFGIPLRTVQRWATGESQCAPYIIGMIRMILAEEQNQKS